MTEVRLTSLLAPSFYGLHRAVKRHRATHYWLKGGRGSCKSTFAAVEIILGIMADPEANAVVLRKVKDTLKDSVFEQLVWAIEKLGVMDCWQINLSPLRLTYSRTGQKILFRGADKPKKIKSVKVSQGYVKFIWFEEVDEFTGMEEIRLILQSLMRGGEQFTVFYSYNPPESARNWVNEEVRKERADRIVHHSDYLTVPREWLGEQFLIEAEHLKQTKPEKYQHEYLGEVTGTGGEIFHNVTLRKISQAEIAAFDNLRRGIDFGYAVDPLAYGVMHYDKTRRRLYIFYELYKVGLSNNAAVKLIKAENKGNGLITADSAEPKSIAEMKSLGLRVVGAKKGPDSVEYGVKFLQDLEEIVIDEERCPNTAREFLGYEYEPDGNGGFKARYPDKDNHTIDMCRYALEADMKSRSAGFVPVQVGR